MKNVSPEFRTHLDKDVTALCTCWQITRKDGLVLRFTDADSDVIRDGDTYRSIGAYKRSAIESTGTLSVDNLEIVGMATDLALPIDELRAGAYDNAEVLVFLTSWIENVEGIVKLRKGFFGEVQVIPNGTFTVELRGLLQRLSHTYTDVFSATCRHDLGNAGCGIDISHPFATEGAHIPAPFIDPGFEDIGVTGLRGSYGWYNPAGTEELVNGAESYSGTYSAFGSDEEQYLIQDMRLFSLGEDFLQHVDNGSVTFTGYGWRKDSPGGRSRFQFRFLSSESVELRANSGYYDLNNQPITVPEITEAGDWTVEAWIRPNNPFTSNPAFAGDTTQEQLFGYTSTTDDKFRGLRLQHQDNEIRYIVRDDGDGAFTALVEGPFVQSANVWVHIAVVHSGTDILLYVDGELVGTGDDQGYGDLHVDTISGSGIVSLDADIDEVRVWTEARTGGQITTGRYRDIETASASLVLYYPFDGDTLDYGVDETGSVSSSGGTQIDGITPVKVYYHGPTTVAQTPLEDTGVEWTLESVEDVAVPPHTRYIRIGWTHLADTGIAELSRLDGMFGWFEDSENTVPMPNFSVGTDPAVWTRAGMATSAGSTRTFTAFIDEPRQSFDGWFQNGLVTFYSGRNAGSSMEVKKWTAATGTVELFLSLPYQIEPGDLFTIYPGCDKTRVGCVALFNNIANFFGTPDVPGEDELLRYPDAKD